MPRRAQDKTPARGGPPLTPNSRQLSTIAPLKNFIPNGAGDKEGKKQSVARMYPTKVPAHFESNAEKHLYHLFAEQLPDDYTVMYSVNWIDPHSDEFHREGEADFVIIHEELGIIVLEVKGGRIELRDGKWYSIDGSDNVHDLKKSPMLQARSSMRTLLDRAKRTPLTRNFQRQYRFHTGVVFPNVPVGPNGLGPDTPRKVVIDRTDLHSLDSALRRVVSDQPPKEPLTKQAIEAFVEIVRPNEVLDELGYADVILESGRRIEAVTEGQNEVLHQLQAQHRIAIPGCAGSGKTLLAMRKTRFLAQSGLRVLLTCYNKPLGDWLHDQIRRDPQIPEWSVRVSNFHRLADELIREAKIAPPRRQSGHQTRRDFFSVEIPEYLFDNAEAIQDRFDAVIVDEGQDFSSAMWAGLQALMNAPEQGIFYVFFDAEQGIYQAGSEFPVKVSDIALMRNLRNTHQIHQHLINYYPGDARPESSEIDGLEPEIIPVPPGQRLRAIQRVFNRLFNDEGIPPDDAVVLTFAGKNNSELHEGDQLGKYTLTWGTGERTANQVQVATVQSFKGLERAIVILVAEIGHIPVHQHDKLIYVGLSRAKQHLVVIGELPEPQGTFTKVERPLEHNETRAENPGPRRPDSPANEAETHGEKAERNSTRIQRGKDNQENRPPASRAETIYRRSATAGVAEHSPRNTKSTQKDDCVDDGKFREPTTASATTVNSSESTGPPPDGAQPPPNNAIAIPSSGNAAVARRNSADIGIIQSDASENTLAAAMCYIFWFIAPLLILVSAPRHRFTRIHAYQGLIFAILSLGYYVPITIVTLFALEFLFVLMCVLWIGWLLPMGMALYYAHRTYSRGQSEFLILSSITRALFIGR